MEEDLFRTAGKLAESTRNELIALKGVVTDLRLHSIHEHLWDDHDGHPGVGLHPDLVPHRHSLRRGQDDHRWSQRRHLSRNRGESSIKGDSPLLLKKQEDNNEISGNKDKQAQEV